MRGKVIAVERVWGGEDGQQPHCKIMVGVAFGRGVDYAQSEAPYVEPGYAAGYVRSGESREHEVGLVGIEAPDPEVPVDVAFLRGLTSGSYAVRAAGRVVNDADRQLSLAASVENPAEVSVEFPTHVQGILLVDLTPRSTMARDVDVVCALLVAPSGIQIDA